MDRSELESYLSEQKDRLKDLGLGLGAHLIQGWPGQYRRAKRFFEKFKEAEDAQNAEEALDHALAFFVFIHSLREWLPKWERVDEKDFNDVWDKFALQRPEMRIARDICNVTKHLSLTQKPSVDKNFVLLWAYDPYDRKRNDWIIYFVDKRIPLSRLMSQILDG
ncbi:MAG: hypothetical protein IPM25_08270, partial [Chloracidobacterium sp.]|nr:hypothetical protein [Chloracidobacterium sp.]